jgi:hypothetical protein
VEVINFLPVRVLEAVMLTPGSGAPPDFTVPRISPEKLGAEAGGWLGAAVGAASVVAVVGVCPKADHAINTTSTQMEWADPNRMQSP